MKKVSLIIFIALFFLLFSCAGTPKTKDTDNKEIAGETAKQNELAEKTDEYSADEQSASEDLTVADMEESFDTETAQTDSDTEVLEDDALLSLETESAAVQEIADATPSVQQPPEQTQPLVQPQTPPPEQAQPPDQIQPSVQPPLAQPPEQTQPPAQPAAEESYATSESAPSDDDSQSRKEPLSSIAGSSTPSTRIESLIQMGTMPHDKEIIFSRIVHATVGQILEIPFRGNGWIYLGEIASRRGIVYNPPRRNDSDGQSFIFTLEEAGTYVLRFYRQDFIRDYILNDHVQVIAGEAPAAEAGWFNPFADRGRVVAQPRWPSAVEETQIRNGVKSPSEPVVTTGTSNETAREITPAQSPAPQQRTVTDMETSAPQRTTPAPETNAVQRTTAPEVNPNRTPTNPPAASSAASGQTAALAPPVQTATVQSGEDSPSAEKQERFAPEVIMQRARESFDSGNISAAIALLDQFMADYPGGSDEVYWQLGQYYEANSPSRNILLSLDYYRRLVNEYPQSKYFNDARRRIAYLERYYINIQ
jgi:hypothetical protein